MAEEDESKKRIPTLCKTYGWRNVFTYWNGSGVVCWRMDDAAISVERDSKCHVFRYINQENGGV